jgi:thiamine biosynthesis lipoprotein
MDTRIEVIGYVSGKKLFSQAIDEMNSECERIEKVFSTTIMGSSLSGINNEMKHGKHYVEPELRGLVVRSLEFAEETNGLFDITIAPIKWLWGLGTGQTGAVPDSEEIFKTLVHVGYKKITLDNDSIGCSDSLVQIDLGGIAKGYALTRLQGILEKHGIFSYLINAGGDVVVGDTKPDGRKWIVGIRHPRNGDSPIGKLELNNCAVVTSGDYERFFMENGRRYHHVFNPATGQPSKGIISATVVSCDPVRADVYSTTLMIKGDMNIKELPKGILRAILVDDSLNIKDLSAESDK